MAVNGRGAWNAKGVGGTKDYRALGSTATITPGPYYYRGTGYDAGTRDANEYACYGAVKAYQTALTEQGFPTVVDGLYGPGTVRTVTAWQQKWKATGDAKASVWGGIGPESSEHLLKPTLLRVYKASPHHASITATIISGVIRTESNWDAGAVGYVDVTDVGLAQINAGAHPEWNTDERLKPALSFAFVIAYLNDAMKLLKYNIRDSIASYNLGVGGARLWISKGRPDWYTPPGSDTPRNVKAYIDKIMRG